MFTGFQIKFSNGWTASVQWHEGNYCHNRSETREKCATAETGAIAPDGSMPLDVQTYQTPEEVAAFISRVAAFPA